MKVVANYKLKYQGEIRRAGIPFEVDADDYDMLIHGWGCRPADPVECTKSVPEAAPDIIEPAPIEQSVETEIVETEAMPEPKKRTRKSRK